MECCPTQGRGRPPHRTEAAESARRLPTQGHCAAGQRYGSGHGPLTPVPTDANAEQSEWLRGPREAQMQGGAGSMVGRGRSWVQGAGTATGRGVPYSPTTPQPSNLLLCFCPSPVVGFLTVTRNFPEVTQSLISLLMFLSLYKILANFLRKWTYYISNGFKFLLYGIIVRDHHNSALVYAGLYMLPLQCRFSYQFSY